MKKPKTVKKEWHAASSKIGMGDFHGSGIKQKVGRLRESYVDIQKPNSLKKPPKSLA